jgi:hypothetical protein
MVALCICTHNPRAGILAAVIRSVAAQDAPPGSFSVVLVDNSSTPALSEAVLGPVRAAGIEATLLAEPVPGLQRARLRAIRATSAEWILWVDDDNELFPDFIRRGLEFIAAHPAVGCFGGRLLLPESLKPAAWVVPFLPSLGIRDLGGQTIVEQQPGWTSAEPPGAGAWVRRSVIGAYLRLAESDTSFFRLGRTGAADLASCDDSAMMRCAVRVGLACAYAPDLRLWHHLSPHRFGFRYLMRLMRAYGRSNVLLERVLAGATAPSGKPTIKGVSKAVLRIPKTAARHGLSYALGRVCYEYGIYEESRRQHQP